MYYRIILKRNLATGDSYDHQYNTIRFLRS